MRGRSALGAAQHLYPVDAQATLAGIVVDEAHRRESQLTVAHDLTHHQPTTVTGTDDQDTALTLAHPTKDPRQAAFVDRASQHPHAHQQHEQQ